MNAPPPLDEALEAHARRVGGLIAAVERGFYGKPDVVELIVVAILARGHVLLEDVPGVGKTTLARAVARAMALDLRRIQFTSDLLPADVLGVSVYDETSAQFVFRPGPIFAHIVLADEINRATPRTQSAMLEAMNERQVTVDDVTRPLDEPFVVVATQNPIEFAGTYPLPESQLDRFLVRLTVGYPERRYEVEVLRRFGHADPVESIEPVMSRDDVLAAQRAVARVHIADDVLGYLMDVVDATRNSPRLRLGASTRAALALSRAAQARALVRGRDFVTPDDVKALVIPVLAHRVLAEEATAEPRRQAELVLSEIVERVPVPR